MDPAYYEYPPGSPQHYAAYKKEFLKQNGIGYPVPNDPATSYEIDNYGELAYDNSDSYDDYVSHGGPDHPEDDPAAETASPDRGDAWQRPVDYGLEPDPEW